MEDTGRRPVRVNPALVHPLERRASLDGEWQFALDPEDHGRRQDWHKAPERLNRQVRVPGTWQGQGFGNADKVMIRDFRLWVRSFRATYTGTGWYGRVLRLPAGWEESRVWLNFGGVHPSAEVWLDGVPVGGNVWPFVPFALELTGRLKPGGEHWLAVRVHEHNRDLGLAYDWQGNWSGLYRSVELTATGAEWLEQFHVLPELSAERLRLRARVGGAGSGLCLRVEAYDLRTDQPVGGGEWSVASGAWTGMLDVPSPLPWSPDDPHLYRVEVTLSRGGEVLDARTERVGFLELGSAGKHFLLNGEPYYLRGTGDFMAHPESASPDVDRERWRRKLTTLREYGYNYVRCQSYVPAPEYFDVADEVGLLVQSEMGVLGAWGGHSEWHVYPWPQPTPDNRERLQRQWDLVVERDVNHPSACLYCMSNEWSKDMPYPRIAWDCYRRTQALRPGAFVIWTDGGYREDLPQDFVNAEAQVDAECPAPVIQHEFRWWSSLPDVRVAEKYTGELRPYAAELLREAAERQGMAHVLEQGAVNSQRLQLAESKGKMEACRRDNPTLAGISHFSATDFCPSPQGILDEFYEHKLADAATWQQTNGDTVVLCGLGFEERVWSAGETVRVALHVSDFAHPPLSSPRLRWRVVSRGEVLGEGGMRYHHIPYRTCPAGELEWEVPQVTSPRAVHLEAELREGERVVGNRWALWLLPAECPLPAGLAVCKEPQYTWLRTVQGLPTVGERPSPGLSRVLLTEEIDEVLLEYARAGGRVILAAGEGLLRPFSPKLGMRQQYYFTPPANYPTYEDGQDGTILQPHPLWGDFPQEGWADLQFFRMIDGYPPLDLGPLDLAAGDPVLRVLHSYPVFRPLGYVVERRVGAGTLLVCALGLNQALAEGRYLLARMCEYAASGRLEPAPELSAEAARQLISGTALA